MPSPSQGMLYAPFPFRMSRKRSATVTRERASLHQLARGRSLSLPILVVDDDVAVRRSIEWLLQGDGYRVVTAADGAEALDRLRKGLDPWLILLDLAMRGMDGFEFRKAQIQDPRLAPIPVAVYSARGMGARKGGLRGVTYLRKPFDAEALLELVEQHCSRG